MLVFRDQCKYFLMVLTNFTNVVSVTNVTQHSILWEDDHKWWRDKDPPCSRYYPNNCLERLRKTTFACHSKSHDTETSYLSNTSNQLTVVQIICLAPYKTERQARSLWTSYYSVQPPNNCMRIEKHFMHNS
jgi:hypothetical protein